MPLLARCPEHPEAHVRYPDEIRAHAAEHPGMSLQAVRDQIKWSMVSQAHARGGNERAISRCAACAAQIETVIPPGGTHDELPTLCGACR